MELRFSGTQKIGFDEPDAHRLDQGKKKVLNCALLLETKIQPVKIIRRTFISLFISNMRPPDYGARYQSELFK